MRHTTEATKPQAADNVIEFPTASKATSFAGWKLDLMRAIRADQNLTQSDKVIAACVVDHVNEVDGTTNISDALIRDETGNSIRTVQRGRAALQAAGWIKMRKTRSSSICQPLTANMPTIAKEQADLREKRKELWSDQTAANVARPANHDARPANHDASASPVADKHSLSSLTEHTLSSDHHIGKPKSNHGHRSQPDDRQEAIRGQYAERPVADRTPPPRRQVDDVGFIALWSAYPRRLGANPRQPAEKAYLRAIKSGATHDAIMAGVRALCINQRKDIGTPYIPQAVTWLNQERWLDYADATAAPITAGMTPEQAKEARRVAAIAENAGFFR